MAKPSDRSTFPLHPRWRGNGAAAPAVGVGAPLAAAVPRRTVLRAATLGVGGALLAACAGSTSGSAGRVASPDGVGRALITVAHADDNLLFINPDEYRLVRGGHPVRVVYLTTGDTGRGAAYWHLREEGAKAGAAAMAGVANQWNRGHVTVNGARLTLDTLVPDPRLSLVFMRLPDGNVNGSGWPDTGHESLMKLWAGTIPTIASADGVRYSRYQLVDTLTALMSTYGPSVVLTQNFLGWFGDGDHSDHVSTGFLTAHACRRYRMRRDAVRAYQGYPVHLLAANVTGSLLAEKERAFLRYSHYDVDGCSTIAECMTPPFFSATYGSWLQRQYLVGTLLTVPGQRLAVDRSVPPPTPRA